MDSRLIWEFEGKASGEDRSCWIAIAAITLRIAGSLRLNLLTLPWKKSLSKNPASFDEVL